MNSPTKWHPHGGWTPVYSTKQIIERFSASVAEQVDASDLKSDAAVRAGSSPAARTNGGVHV